ncbi:MAG TPA: phage head closure protein [Bosea sp. (in: a-proteobacteria)]|jgi:SPP1 family predicted phage head-tail adaptor|uniref:phage head closure protein n=1 Tax=Bosea sp. (in: a-proteobacteria) TaxID=1871050 RepID=UPI002E135F64|nr:phage head closure protein [Bosea sp. (in: a-proteobacteria)]
MISSGKLDRTIRIERAHSVIGAAGRESVAWTTVATVRAELLQADAVEVPGSHGIASTDSLAFRLRYLAGITPADRVVFDDRSFNIRTVKEIGRRRALELTCEGRPNG